MVGLEVCDGGGRWTHLLGLSSGLLQTAPPLRCPLLHLAQPLPGALHQGLGHVPFLFPTHILETGADGLQAGQLLLVQLNLLHQTLRKKHHTFYWVATNTAPGLSRDPAGVTYQHGLSFAIFWHQYFLTYYKKLMMTHM